MRTGPLRPCSGHQAPGHGPDDRTHIFLVLAALVSAVSAQQGTIEGVVSTLENGAKQAQPFANVLIKGTSTGVNTDLHGHFSINTLPGSVTLVVSLVGHPNVEKRVYVVANKTIMANITLDGGGLEMNVVQVVRSAA